MFKKSSPLLSEWRYDWKPDFYDWLTDRPDPMRRRVWRFRGKAPTQWFPRAYLNPSGSGCTGAFQHVVKCIDGTSGGRTYLPASDCAQELSNYFQCMEFSKKFQNHWRNDVVPSYKQYLETFDDFQIKRTSWKQSRNLIKLWYGMPNLKSRSTQGPPHLKRAWYGKFPYFADGLYTPEGWDSRVADDNLRSLIKDTVYPHTPFQRGQLPFIEHKLKYGKGMPDYVPHAGAPGGVIAPPI